ncbi:MAG: DUF58 domain-containing protein [Candidatus Limivicinus sp.]|nr:DUF58 domain-containing protein [Candidatus Limivicinus sp.]
MPTFHFFLYLAAVAAAYVFKLAYIGWFGPYLMGALCLLPPVLVLFSLPSMLKLSAEISAPDRVSRGGSAALCIHFKSGAFLPVSRVNIVIQVENRYDGESKKQKYSYAGVLSSTGKVPLPTELCGMLHCTVTRLECRDLLGLIAIRRRCTAKAVCTVLPLPAQPDKCPDIDACLETTAQLKPKYGGGYSEEHELREYRPGDTVNSIHWKLSSKTDEIIVREALEQANNQVFLVLSRPGEKDRGLECLYWLSLQLCNKEIPHVIVSGRMYPVGNEDESAAALCEILSAPLSPPCCFDRSHARCVFTLSDGEVRA